MGILKKIFGTKTQSIDDSIEEWNDVEVLQNFMQFMGRVQIGTEFVQDDNGFIVAEVLHIQCGDKEVKSPPLVLDWPLEPVAWPEDAERTVN